MEYFYGKGSDNVILHYVRKGTEHNRTVILLHGWPGYWFDWRYVIPSLSESFNVIAPDFRGFGNSDKPNVTPQEGYTPEHHARDIISLMKNLNIEKAILVAHDIGATVAQTIAKSFPEYVEGLVLLNPPYQGIGTRRFEPSIQKEFWYQHLHNLTLVETIIGNSKEAIKHYITYFYDHWTGSKVKATPEDLEKIVNLFCQEDFFMKSIAYYRARAAAKTVQSINQTQAAPIRQKTEVLWGEEDPVMLAAWSDKLEDYFSDVSLKKLSRIGHFVPFEAPDEVVAAVIKLDKKITR
ncbi:alpha/beta hydrolase [Bacillus sp. 1P10SD]|uniref:alpha/beta fold hydrolase n=1 Tax=Bacillus sp. 1P10SD TaxID=3132265 RepID=UPI0039A5C013